MSLGILLIGLAIIVVICLLWVIGMYNTLVQRKTHVDEAWSGIDVQLKRRYDLIPNLVATVKQYGVHEQSIFEKIAASRAASMQAHSIPDKASAESELTQTLRTLFAVVENYPTLKANENFMALQKDLNTLETEIQLARRYYNGTVRNYNIAVVSFPSRIIAQATGYEKAPYFELTGSHERENPRVQF